jgi:hypothetical protein
MLYNCKYEHGKTSELDGFEEIALIKEIHRRSVLETFRKSFLEILRKSKPS